MPPKPIPMRACETHRGVALAAGNSLVVASGLASRTGKRKANEDYCAVYDGTERERATHGLVAAVADGVGGAKGGRIAAELAVRSFIDGYYAAPSTIGVAACAGQAMGPYNSWLHRMGIIDPEMEGAATTFTALVLRGRRVHALHVGDSRAWRLRGGVLTRLTEDHVLPQPALRHVLYRALGVESDVRLDNRIEELALHDRLLLTSDGIHGALSDRTIAMLLDERGSPQADAEAIVEAALAAGSSDNVTAVVLDVIELPPADYDSIAAAFVPCRSFRRRYKRRGRRSSRWRADFGRALHAPVPRPRRGRPRARTQFPNLRSCPSAARILPSCVR